MVAWIRGFVRRRLFRTTVFNLCTVGLFYAGTLQHSRRNLFRSLWNMPASEGGAHLLTPGAALQKLESELSQRVRRGSLLFEQPRCSDFGECVRIVELVIVCCGGIGK